MIYLFAESDTSCAEYAAFCIQTDGTYVNDLGFMDLVFKFETAWIKPILHVICLQPAFTCLVADGAVYRMVNQRKFQYSPDSFSNLRGICAHLHTIGNNG